jgi:multidrug efflux pump subunit AcrA (membrane-fusion protein)
VKEGQRVKAGQVLARVDATDAQLSVRSAEATLREAEARLQQLLDGPALAMRFVGMFLASSARSPSRNSSRSTSSPPSPTSSTDRSPSPSTSSA